MDGVEPGYYVYYLHGPDKEPKFFEIYASSSNTFGRNGTKHPEYQEIKYMRKYNGEDHPNFDCSRKALSQLIKLQLMFEIALEDILYYEFGLV